MRLILALAVLMACAGCGTDHHHPLFKPEISGAVYAVPSPAADPTADDARAISGVTQLPRPKAPCVFTQQYGWTCPGTDIDADWVLYDDDLFLAAPRFHVVPSTGTP